MKTISILGSTGSIGTQALDIVRMNPNDFEIYALACNKNIDLFEKQIKEFKPKYAVIYDDKSYSILKGRYVGDTKLLSGIDSLIKISSDKEVDFVLGAIVGNIGLIPIYHSVLAGKQIGLANKETLVTAGELLMPLAKKHAAEIIPVDSEHSAIYQCLKGHNKSEVSKIILTASGGPFRKFTKEELIEVTPSQALKHPNWDMGRKITIDSATLMNKGLEVIEAKWLFDVDIDKIDVVVHPQSIIHSMVEYTDYMVLAQLGIPSMKGPISYAMNYPYRKPIDYKPLNLVEVSQLTFEKPDKERFPCLDLAYKAVKMGGTATTILNAANEELVYKFLDGKIKFYDISNEINRYLDVLPIIDKPSLEDILEIDSETRRRVRMER